jgi:hypothetical protein
VSQNTLQIQVCGGTAGTLKMALQNTHDNLRNLNTSSGTTAYELEVSTAAERFTNPLSTVPTPFTVIFTALRNVPDFFASYRTS